MKIEGIREVGGSRQGTLGASYEEIVAVLGEPNCTDLDDEYKVKASWGFKDADTGREGFIWCYRFWGEPEQCTSWSIDGDKSLLGELFPGRLS